MPAMLSVMFKITHNTLRYFALVAMNQPEAERKLVEDDRFLDETNPVTKILLKAAVL